MTGVLTMLASDTFPIAHPTDTGAWAGWILWLPLLSMVLCGVCAAVRVKGKLPAWITIGGLGLSFVLTLVLYLGYDGPVTIELFRWFDLSWEGGGLLAAFSLYVDQLTLLWMLFVTALGTLIAVYASEYMEHDVGGGYARFFAGVSVFLFAMSALVMGDNLLMLYLGWEGVGFASYWLIGYYYTRPSAVAAAKKAFIVNRIGDLGLALGLYLTWQTFGRIDYAGIFEVLEAGDYQAGAGGWTVSAIPFLLVLGAVGKSAQIPLYVWLPDAMEGPTPVSALIHAATMVTAGVYLLARLFPLMQLHPAALPTVAWIGALTALLAATIGMAQYDIKRIMAYSTISQLGYMFLGIGVMTTFGAAYHVFTHAFFKAVLFLTCGAIMHGFAGQLDLRKLSGLRHMPGWRITSYTMLYACLCLVGFPFLSSGFWSKDLIMAEAFVVDHGSTALGLIAVVTALLTAYYTFRVWFRVCAGPVQYEMGDEHHGDDGHDDDHAHAAKPHAPRLAINGTLLVITLGAFLAIFAKVWAKDMTAGSSAMAGVPQDHGGDAAHSDFWHDPHQWMPYVASAVTLSGVLIAWYFHLWKREAADSVRRALDANALTRWLPRAMENKWYVDELYDYLLRKPLWVLGQAFYAIDRYIIDMLIVDTLLGRFPKFLGRAFQPLQNGVLQSYAISMAGGAGLVALLVLYMPDLMSYLQQLLNGGSGMMYAAMLMLIVPLLGAIAIAFAPVSRAKWIALGASSLTFVVSLVAAMRFQHWTDGEFGMDTHDGFAWLPELGISISTQADSVSMLLVVLTTMLVPLCVIGSFTAITERIREYYAWLLILMSAMIGVFIARDLILFYICFEFTLVPMYFLIAIYGSENRAWAATKFFIVTFTGSLIALAGLLYVAWRYAEGAGEWSFDIPTLTVFARTLPPTQQGLVLLALMLGFGVKVPLFPLHTWLPLAHTEAPTAGSVILAAVLLKLGTYGLYRFVLPMLPDAVVAYAPAIAVISIIGILYAGLLCWVQDDMKKLIAYSSVSHLGFCVLGLFSLNPMGVQGSVLYMLNHGLSTGALFFLVGMMYERYHTRDMNAVGGLARKMPVWSFFMVFFVLSSVGLPGLNGFVSEFLCLIAAFTANGDAPVYPGVLGPWYGAFAGAGMIVAAMYLLIMVGKVVFGPLREPKSAHDETHHVLPADIGAREIAVLVPLAVLCVVIGFRPGILTDTIAKPAENVLAEYPARVRGETQLAMPAPTDPSEITFAVGAADG